MENNKYQIKYINRDGAIRYYYVDTAEESNRTVEIMANDGFKVISARRVAVA